MIRRHESSNVSLKPGRVASPGQMLGERYSGKLSALNCSVGAAQDNFGST
jgi:hypothetical protein